MLSRWEVPFRGTSGFFFPRMPHPLYLADPNCSSPKAPILHLPACCIFPLKAGKYFFLFFPLISSFSSLSLLLKRWACSSQFLQWCVLSSWLVVFVRCSPNGSPFVFREGIEQLLSCVGIQYYEHFSNSSTWLYEKKGFFWFWFFFWSPLFIHVCAFSLHTF